MNQVLNTIQIHNSNCLRQETGAQSVGHKNKQVTTKPDVTQVTNTVEKEITFEDPTEHEDTYDTKALTSLNPKNYYTSVKNIRGSNASDQKINELRSEFEKVKKERSCKYKQSLTATPHIFINQIKQSNQNNKMSDFHIGENAVLNHSHDVEINKNTTNNQSSRSQHDETMKRSQGIVSPSASSGYKHKSDSELGHHKIQDNTVTMIPKFSFKKFIEASELTQAKEGEPKIKKRKMNGKSKLRLLEQNSLTEKQREYLMID